MKSFLNSDDSYAWSYKWFSQTKATDSNWCYFEELLPSNYKGGLILSHTDAGDTNFALRYSSSDGIERYYNKKTATTNSIAHTGKIPIASA